MKALLITAVSFFLFSIIFRFQHWPGGNLMSVLSVFLIFIFAIINSFKQKKVFKISILGGWLVFTWTWYILTKYLFWYGGPSIFVFNTTFLVALLLTIIYVVITITDKEKKLSKAIVVLSVFGFFLSLVPAYSICYLFDLNEVINKEYNETNFYSWDKYSWFLYIRGENDRALDANQKAINAWYSYVTKYGNEDLADTQTLNLLNNHREEIMNGTWTDGYVDLRY